MIIHKYYFVAYFFYNFDRLLRLEKSGSVHKKAGKRSYFFFKAYSIKQTYYFIYNMSHNLCFNPYLFMSFFSPFSFFFFSLSIIFSQNSLKCRGGGQFENIYPLKLTGRRSSSSPSMPATHSTK